MRPVSLTLAAFGSYEKTESIDFTALSEQGIFLICGPTGGGKTTILDAISVALYGKPTGSLRLRQSKMFRCKSADPKDDTVVDFIFDIGDTRYRFYKRWRWGKIQGEYGLKDAEGACYILNKGYAPAAPDNGDTASGDGGGMWTILASGKTKTLEAEAERILGLSYEQFVKVICLPQGEFRELLTADSKTRTEIFDRLFGTDRWKMIIAAANDRARDIQNRISLLREHISGLLTGSEFDTPQKLRLGAEQSAAICADLEEQLRDANERLAAADANLSSAIALDSRFQALDKASAQLEKLAEQSEYIDGIAERISRDQTLSELLPKYSVLDDARSQESKAQTAMAQCHDRLLKSGAILDDATQRLGLVDELSARLEQARSELTLLRSVKEKAEEIYRLDAEIADSSALLSDCEAELAANASDTGELQKRIDKGTALIAECDAAIACMPAAVTARNDAEAYLEKLLLTERLTEQKARSKELYDSAAAEYDRIEKICADKKQLLTALEQLTSADAAYDLSKKLAAGMPCPVCGSTEHPAPAPPPSGAPDPRITEKVREELEMAQAELERAASRLSEQTADYRLKSEQLEAQPGADGAGGTPLSADEARKALGDADSRLSRIRQSAEKKQEYQALLDRLAARQKALREKGEKLGAQKAEITALLSTAQGRRGALTSELSGRNISFGNINASITEHEALCASLDSEIRSARSDHEKAEIASAEAGAALSAAKQALDAAKERRSRLEAEYYADCLARGVDTECNIPDTLLDPEEAAALKERLEQYRSSVSSAAATREQLEKELSGSVRPQLGEIRAIRDALNEKTGELLTKSGRAAQLSKQLSAAAAELDRSEREMDVLTGSYTEAKRISAFLSGANEKKTPIDQFVAGLFLDEIITAANGYWNALSRGQYALRRREEAVGRQRSQGVDFEVIDAHIGAVRDVCSLSGGELFLASLSLAFGLSDVVQGFSGGMRLDSIFIDEGFGSLDHESLELAMNAVGRMRDGRLVGIISHIEELRSRVRSRIEVTKDRSGSHINVLI